MIRSRPLALLAALLLLPGEAARAGAWCGAAGGAAMSHEVAGAERAAGAGAGADTPMPASHAAHHALMMHDGAAMTDHGAESPTADDARARDHDGASAVVAATPVAPAAPASHRGPNECPLMAACASAAVALRVTWSDNAAHDVAQRVNAAEPAALATRSIAPEPPPPR